jgi:hypothetical protein
MAVSLLDKVSEIQTLSIKKAKRWFLFRYNFHNFQPSLESVTFALVSSLSLSLSLSLPPSLSHSLSHSLCVLPVNASTLDNLFYPSSLYFLRQSLSLNRKVVIWACLSISAHIVVELQA